MRGEEGWAREKEEWEEGEDVKREGGEREEGGRHQ